MRHMNIKEGALEEEEVCPECGTPMAGFHGSADRTVWVCPKCMHGFDDLPGPIRDILLRVMELDEGGVD